MGIAIDEGQIVVGEQALEVFCTLSVPSICRQVHRQ
jgi:hypothetical protein